MTEHEQIERLRLLGDAWAKLFGRLAVSAAGIVERLGDADREAGRLMLLRAVEFLEADLVGIIETLNGDDGNGC